MGLLEIIRRLDLRSPYRKTQALNNATYDDYYTRLRLMALASFKWEGLPESVDARYLEHVLFMDGKALFFRDPALGLLCLGCTSSDQLNVYHVPIKYTAVSIGYNKQYSIRDIWKTRETKDPANAVLIRNNYDMIPTTFPIELFAHRLATAERVIDSNINQQRFPFFIRMDEKQRATFNNLMNQYEGGQPFIFGDKMMSMGADAFQVLATGVPYVADKLTDYRHDIMNEALTFLGLNNANTDKRERLITGEVDSNNQAILTNAEIMLLTRQEAAEQINKMFGLSVSVHRRIDDLAPIANDQAEPDGQEDDPAAADQGKEGADSDV